MAQFSVPYGKRDETFDIPERCKVWAVQSKPSRAIENVEAGVLAALEHPIGSKPFREIFRRGEKVVIVVSDVTRLWVRSDLLLPILLDELNHLGIPDGDITVLMATGDHRYQTPEEHRLIAGERVLGRVKVVDHDCQADDLVDLGRSSRGTTVLMNRLVCEADRVILTGGICYHLLAGFGGGRKSLAPGVAGYRTIQENHGLAITSKTGRIGSGIMRGNPVAEDLDEIAAMVDPDFLLNVVVNEHKEFISIVAGHWREAHLAGTKVVEDTFGIRGVEQADVVIASAGGYPKDIQLYQSIKALDNAAYAVRDGGDMILVSECFDGPGPDSFLRWFQYKSYEEMSRALYANFTMPGFVALRTAEVLKSVRVHLVSGLEDELVGSVGMKPARSVNHALGEILAQGKVESVNLMPHAAMTFPIVEGKRKVTVSA